MSDAASNNPPADVQTSPANEATVARSVCTTPDSDIDLHQRVSPSPDDMKADPSDTQLDLASIPPEIEPECLQPTTVVPQLKPTIRTPERECAGFSVDNPIELDNALEPRAMIEQSRSVACCPSSNLAPGKNFAPISSLASMLAPELGAGGIELTSTPPDDSLTVSTFSPCTTGSQTTNQPALPPLSVGTDSKPPRCSKCVHSLDRANDGYKPDQYGRVQFRKTCIHCRGIAGHRPWPCSCYTCQPPREGLSEVEQAGFATTNSASRTRQIVLSTHEHISTIPTVKLGSSSHIQGEYLHDLPEAMPNSSSRNAGANGKERQDNLAREAERGTATQPQSGNNAASNTQTLSAP